MGRPAEILNSVIPKQRPQQFRQWRGLRRWGPTGFSGCEDVPWSDNHAARLGEELGEWVLNTDQTRVRRGTIEHDVEPVFVAKIAGTCPFVCRNVDLSCPSASLHFNRSAMTGRVYG